MRFPSLAVKHLPRESSMLVDELQATLVDTRWSQGYMRLYSPAGYDHVLFVHQGKAHFAGAIEEERFLSCTFLDVFDAVSEARSIEYCACDSPLLLAMAVPFRKAPSAQLPAGTATRESLVEAIEISMMQTGGRDAVLSFRRKDAVSLLLWRPGTAGWLYAAPGERLPEAGNAAERISAYLAAFNDVAVDVYDEVVLPAAAGAGKPFREYVNEAEKRAMIPTGLVPSLVITLGGRIVYRYVMDRDEIRVGRGGENDLALDNRTVSRAHAKIERRGDALFVSDLGSENGLMVGAKRVKELTLKPGDRVDIGKYTLLYDHYAPKTQAAQNPAVKGPRSAEETIGISTGMRSATFHHAGNAVKMSGMVFHIGKGEDAHLKIGGMFVAPIHVRVIRDTSGNFTATHVGGGRAMTVNGKAEKEVQLKNGDEIEIAGSVVKIEISAAPRVQPLDPR